VGWMLKPKPRALRRKQIQTKAKIAGRLLKPVSRAQAPGRKALKKATVAGWMSPPCITPQEPVSDAPSDAHFAVTPKQRRQLARSDLGPSQQHGRSDDRQDTDELA